MKVLPKHIAIIMDGNGRWAERRKLPRVAGHQQGVESLRAIVRASLDRKIEQLTLFAFSSENWLRPQNEVNFLLSLALKLFQKKELQTLCKNNVQIQIIGDRSPFSLELKQAMLEAEQETKHNTGLKVNIALNYGGQWDIVQAARKLCENVAAGKLNPSEVTEKTFQSLLSLSTGSPPDLLIRSSGEQRISNFLLWDIAYSELYFTDTLWPDFREAEFDAAIEAFSQRQRRFGNIETTIEENIEANIGAKAFALQQEESYDSYGQNSKAANGANRETDETRLDERSINELRSTEYCVST